MSETPDTKTGNEQLGSSLNPQPDSAERIIDSVRLPAPTQPAQASWDIGQLRLPQSYILEEQETVQVSVPIGKPRPQVYFRTHPEWHVLVATVTHEDTLYIVAAPLVEALEGDLRIKLIVPYISRDGDVGLWPVNQLQASGRGDAWTASAHRAMVASRTGWVRLRSNMRAGSYDLIRPKAVWDEPTWPNETFEALLESAFQDRVIANLDHPVVRALKGEA